MISAAELAKLLNAPEPTDEQAAIIESPQQPAVIIAGAGSGKTETMAARVLWLVANQLIDPGAVLGLTFTRKAAGELGARIRRRLAQWRRVVEADRDAERLAALLSGEPTVLTYAAYAGRLVGRARDAGRGRTEPAAAEPGRALAAGRPGRAPLRRRPADRHRLAGLDPGLGARAVRLAGRSPRHPRSGRAVLRRPAGRVGAAAARSADQLADPGRHRQADRVDRAPARADGSGARLRRGQARSGGVDYADQMTLAARLAAVPEVAAIERARFGVVLLDEYQDTGHAQVVMLAGLFGGGHPVTAVGDPFQSIYGWRGASAGNIGRFAGQFRTVDDEPAAVYPLSTSWRNDRQILTVANEVAQPLRAAVAGAGMSVGAIELRAAPGGRPGYGRRHPRRDGRGRSPLGRRPVAMRPGTSSTSARAGRTAAVLVRRRSQIPLLADALVAAGLPIEVVGLGGLLVDARDRRRRRHLAGGRRPPQLDRAGPAADRCPLAHRAGRPGRARPPGALPEPADWPPPRKTSSGCAKKMRST